MTGRAADLAVVTGVAMVFTLLIAAPVLRAPSERIFGMEIVGRHYDPFTVMEQFAQPIRWTAVLQPVTDLPGAVLAKYIGPVASYNLLVLLSFPFTALTAYLLARYCALAPLSAAGAALAVAFSPFHVAHAAYHPQVAQLQWVPLYLLLLWRCLDWPTRGGLTMLTASSIAVTLSNFYGGLIAIAITPVAMASYWFFKMRRDTAASQRLVITSAALAVVGVAGALYAFYFAGDAFQPESVLSFGRRDLLKYRAAWWSYLVPPIAQPWSRHVTATTDSALLEQQLSLGWALLTFSVVAIAAWLRQRATVAVLSAVPVLVSIALFALACSLSPTTFLYGVLPMFRSYARFGSVVQLMVALLAAIGAERMWHSKMRGARMLAGALALIAVAEYAVWPPHLWRDVLPTAAHRWATQQSAGTRVLDCYPNTQESQSIQWLTSGRVILRPASVGDCREPGFLATLSATGFTHLLVRRNTPEGRWFDGRTPPAGLSLVRAFTDAQVFAIPSAVSVIRTTSTTAFFPVEFDADWTWRWMAGEASWTVNNSTERFLMASVDVETSAFEAPRRLSVLLDGAPVQDVLVQPHRSIQRIGPLALRPGTHTLIFRAITSPVVADDIIHNGDRRPLSVAFGDWRWSIDTGTR